MDHPDKVERAAVLDIIPTHYLWSRVDKAFAESAYHWFFFARPAPFPETVIANSLELFVGRGDGSSLTGRIGSRRPHAGRGHPHLLP